MAKMIFHKLTAISGIRNKHKKRRKDGNLMKKTDQDNKGIMTDVITAPAHSA